MATLGLFYKNPEHTRKLKKSKEVGQEDKVRSKPDNEDDSFYGGWEYGWREKIMSVTLRVKNYSS